MCRYLILSADVDIYLISSTDKIIENHPASGNKLHTHVTLYETKKIRPSKTTSIPTTTGPINLRNIVSGTNIPILYTEI
jgi:hypothetical protein